jgi:hypothetical protein
MASMHGADAVSFPAQTAQTVTVNGIDQTNYNARGVTVVVVTTAIGTGSITVTIQGKDPGSGTYYTLLAGAAIVTNTTNRYTVYPSGIAAVANVTAVDSLPNTWRIIVTANNANPATYTVGGSTLA